MDFAHAHKFQTWRQALIFRKLWSFKLWSSGTNHALHPFVSFGSSCVVFRLETLSCGPCLSKRCLCTILTFSLHGPLRFVVTKQHYVMFAFFELLSEQQSFALPRMLGKGFLLLHLLNDFASVLWPMSWFSAMRRWHNRSDHWTFAWSS